MKQCNVNSWCCSAQAKDSIETTKLKKKSQEKEHTSKMHNKSLTLVCDNTYMREKNISNNTLQTTFHWTAHGHSRSSEMTTSVKHMQPIEGASLHSSSNEHLGSNNDESQASSQLGNDNSNPKQITSGRRLLLVILGLKQQDKLTMVLQQVTQKLLWYKKRKGAAFSS